MQLNTQAQAVPAVSDALRKLAASQEPLGTEFEAVLNKHRSELYAEAAPQPEAADEAMRKDAERWQMAVLIGNEVMLHPDRRTHVAAVAAYHKAVGSGADLLGAIDAALAAQGGV